jgi:DNA polymerase-3 subunit gamma/tau
MGQALYRKWRPQTFNDVVGQEHVVRTLRNALLTEQMHHAYLLAGPRGTGKTTIARLIAKAVNCLSPLQERPCGTCEMCLAVADGSMLDLVEVDGASATGVDNVRDIIEKSSYRPAQGRYKVYIIDEVHQLSQPASSALLKTLEEPPEHVIFVLATTEIHKILETIISRCQRFEFRRIPLEIITAQLQKIAAAEEIDVEPEALTLIARAATGSMRDAISLFDQMSVGGTISADNVRLMLGAERREVVRSLLQTWLNEDLNQGLTIINNAVDSGADPRQIARQATDFLRGLLLMRLGAGQAWDDPTGDERPLFEEMARQASVADLVRAVEYFSAAAEQRRTGWQPQLALEMALIQAVQPEAPIPQNTPESSPATSAMGTSQTSPSRPANVAKAKPRRPAGHTRTTGKNPGNGDQHPAAAQVTNAAVQVFPGNDTNLAAKVQESWQGVIQRMKNVSLGALLRDASVAGIDEQGKLVLTFQHTFHRQKVDDPVNRQELENVLTNNFNVQVNVRCLMNGDWLPPEHTVASAEDNANLDEPSSLASDIVEEDVLIRRAQEELGAVAKVDEN